ncbi:uncharacterized protein F5Z01DRAFT_635090 [Emericellopsis atlantica]|uniref:Nitrate reductase [NADPH] n=1 Tax=Emericellopsis atlantica TaxID=2614577 RepID=A0A9P8CRA9_9HYPO|nr:uncharacterized protein F5Z01DRAFT_635090 [Emericellopsis atlantica]KAG9256137.1 hypothetical protein F5Z01DRAFT_635090 [Emericellopsis atlantica]
MPHNVPWTVTVQPHPGSSTQDIANEPEWGFGHEHRIGFKNRSNRLPGITHKEDRHREDVVEEKKEQAQLQNEAKEGKLLNFRELIQHQKDFHLRCPENRSLGWRYVLNTTEDWVKNEQEWPANQKSQRRGKQTKATQVDDVAGGEQQEHEWKKSGNGDHDKHNDAYTTGDVAEDNPIKDKYTPQERALLRALEHEREYVQHLSENDGQGRSPQTRNRRDLSIDEQDQFTPDNWLPRSPDLIRLTGKHPLNAEAHLSHLYDAGLITPNELHYVRNHGAVPRILWEFHQLDVEFNGETTSFSMPQLQEFDSINIPIALACDGNRRKELNMIKKSKGFGWGPGGVSCAYWKGALLRDVLLATGIPETLPDQGQKRRYWVNFEGADEPSEGKYSTCIPFQYAMNSSNDVILAYEMNDVPLPPDHGYPLRLMIPGYVGGRCVKWLRRIWISDKENDSYYHTWDNRVVPSFVTEKDGPFAESLFRHPDTACNEQNLNSVVVKPAHGERILLSSARKGENYRIQGYAYDGGGHEVQRVEVSLDDGKTWLYCLRRFPDSPIRHGNKYWTWLHWHVDVEISHLLRAHSITVRCFNVFKNTQPREPSWNVMGMMNNCWYVVKPEIVDDKDSKEATLVFWHPTEVGSGEGGWMKPSVENQIAEAKQQAGTPQKQFTREEIEKHDSKDDCWIVVDGKVYDATSVLEWHPGGAAAILGHAGQVHQETSDEFAGIHDDYAYQKLKECALGTVTDKAANFIKQNAEQAAKRAADSEDAQSKVVLEKHRWHPVKMIARRDVSKDTRTYRFQLPDNNKVLGLGTCQHVEIGFHLEDRMLIRSYTPTKPLLPLQRADESDKTWRASGSPGDDTEQSLADGEGMFDLTIKTYFPDQNQPGGAMSNILDCIPIGEEVEIKGPTGEIEYHGNGEFTIEGQRRHFARVSLVLGGSGITPGYSLIARILLTQEDKTQLRVVDANKTESDILLRDELAQFERDSQGQLKITHVLSHPSDTWQGEKGHVNEEILQRCLFAPDKSNVAFLCGPSGLIQKAALPALRSWGYVEDDNMFGF